MRACGIFFLVCIATTLPPISAGGTCEKIERKDWEGSIGTVKTCFMQTTAINSKNFSVTSDRDEAVKGFWADDNKNLEHLPNNLGTKFPNLFTLFAGRCSIKEIKKNRFKGLNKLKHLDLYGNQIEKIDDDTFEYISAVEEIWLGGNKIKKLNGRAFASLHKLTWVNLGSNECIDEIFIYAEIRIAEMHQIVTEKCGFTESEPSSTKIVETEANLMAQSQD